MHRKSLLQSIRSILLFPLAMELLLFTEARFINPHKSLNTGILFPGSPGDGQEHTISKRDAEGKKTLAFNNIGINLLQQLLYSENLTELEGLFIHQDGLDSVKFLERLNFPVLKNMEITNNEPEAPTGKLEESRRLANIKPRIRWNVTLYNLEINTNGVFEGIHSLVDNTCGFLSIPLPVFIKMHSLGPVNLAATSIKFTRVKASDLVEIKGRNRNGRKRNTLVKDISFITDVEVGKLGSIATKEIVNEILGWVRMSLSAIRCINIEEKNFVEPAVLRIIYLKKTIFNDLPNLNLIGINNLIIQTKYDSILIENFKKATEENIYRCALMRDIINISEAENINCLEVLSAENLKTYLIKKNSEFMSPRMIGSFLWWYSLDKRRIIAESMK